MRRTRISWVAFSVLALIVGVGQVSFLAAGKFDPVEPERLLYRADIKPISDGAPEFSANKAGAFLMEIQVGLDPGTYSGKLLTHPGDDVAVCACPDEDGGCACVINPRPIRRR